MEELRKSSTWFPSQRLVLCHQCPLPCEGPALPAGCSPALSLPPPSQPGDLGSSLGLWHQGLTHGSCISLLLAMKEHARIKVQCSIRAGDDSWISFPQDQVEICSCTLLPTGVRRWWCLALPGLGYNLLRQQKTGYMRWHEKLVTESK